MCDSCLFSGAEILSITSNPWHQVSKNGYQRGQIVAGEVVSIEDYGAFVELEPGLVGVLHVSEIPDGNHGNIREALWIGVLLEVYIKDINVERRRISLSVTECLRQHGHGGFQKPGHGSAHLSRPQPSITRVQNLPLMPKADPSSRRIQRVLVVDDDRSSARDFARWLRRLGYHSKTAHTVESTLSQDLANIQFVFLDVDLPDQPGPSIAAELYEKNPDLEIILMTGHHWINGEIKMPPDLEVAGFLTKPLDYAEIKRLLIEAEDGPLPRFRPTIAGAAKQRTFSHQQPSSKITEFEDTSETLEAMLGKLQQETEADSLLLLSMNSLTRQLDIVAQWKLDAQEISEQALQNAGPGVVTDVLLKGQQVLEREATTSRRFERLLALILFDSCIGVPLPVDLSERRYGLFLFRRERHSFTPEHAERARRVAQTIAALLQREFFFRRLRDAQRFLLVGQLTASLLHELRNKLNRLELQAQLLAQDCIDLAEGPPMVPASRWAHTLSRRTEKIALTNATLRDLTQQYLGLIGKEETKEIDVNALIHDVLGHMAPLVEETRVQIETRLDTAHLATTTIPLRLEQVLLNVLLNAIQMMGQHDRRGRVQIKAHRDIRDDRFPIKVRVADTARASIASNGTGSSRWGPRRGTRARGWGCL